jgi:hypothetical protein
MSYPIVKVGLIERKYAKKLAKAGIRTTDTMLYRSRKKEDRKRLAEETGIEPGLILKFAQIADLLMINRVGLGWIELLVGTGIKSVDDLGKQNPKKLYEKMAITNDKNSFEGRLPSIVYVERWVEEAKYVGSYVE